MLINLNRIYLYITLFCFAGFGIPLLLSNEIYQIYGYDFLLKIYNYTPLIIFCIITVKIGKVKYYKQKYLSRIILYYILIIIIISTYLSVNRVSSLVLNLSLILNILLAIYFIRIFNFEEVLNIILRFLKIAILISILYVIIVPSLGVMEGFHDGAWRGAFTHKNGLGAIAGFALIMLLLKEKRNFQDFLFMFLALLLLIKSDSITSLVSFFIISILFIIIQLKKYNNKLAIASLVIMVLFSSYIIYYTYSNYIIILEIFGKSPQLTGRTELWANLFNAIKDRPIFGYGNFSFWNNEAISSKYLNTMVWETGKAHNLIIDIILSFGVLGLFGFILLYIKTIKCILYNKIISNHSIQFIKIYIIYYLVLGLTELVFSHNHVYTFVLIMIFLLTFKYKKNNITYVMCYKTKNNYSKLMEG